MLACSAGFIFGQIAMPGSRSAIRSANMSSNTHSGESMGVIGTMSGATIGTAEVRHWQSTFADGAPIANATSRQQLNPGPSFTNTSPP